MIWSRLAFLKKKSHTNFTYKFLIIRINMYNWYIVWCFFHLKSSKMLKLKRWQNYVHLNISSNWPKKEINEVKKLGKRFLGFRFSKKKEPLRMRLSLPKKLIFEQNFTPQKSSVKNVDLEEYMGWSFFHWNQVTKLDVHFGHGLKVVGPRKKLQCEWGSEVGQEIRWAGTLV